MLHLMEEIAKELAKILVPIASKKDGERPEDYEARAQHADDERKRLVGALMAAASISPAEDPVLAKLDELAAIKADIQRQIALILAYAREFVRPEPYRLKSLGKATKMSISGVRTAYSSEDVAYIADALRRKNNNGTFFPNQEKAAQSTSQAPELPDGQWWAVQSNASTVERSEASSDVT
jgi:hypothetical protein